MTGRDSRGRRAAHDEIDPDFFFSESPSARNRRKDYQLCGQVQRALGEALAADFDDELLSALIVDGVEPAPTLARLRVWVVAPRGSDPDRVLQRLARVAAYLRGEVAAAISRKQVPSLHFALREGDVADGCTPEEEEP